MNGMVATDIATRVWNHTFKLDPIVRSLLDTDFYKLLMLQMVRGLHPETQVTFKLINRTTFGKRSEKLPADQLALALEDQQVALCEAEGQIGTNFKGDVISFLYHRRRNRSECACTYRGVSGLIILRRVCGLCSGELAQRSMGDHLMNA